MSILEEITRLRRSDVEDVVKRGGMDAVVARASALVPPPRLAEALQAPGLGIIAEFKRRTPSAGLLAPAADPALQSGRYQAGGAAAISVLAESRHFGGSFDDVEKIARSCRLPVLCKDFVVHPYQIYAARAAGASAVLLITSMLSDEQLKEWVELANDLDMDALVEVHTEEELERALAAGAEIVGINNRDLRDFSVSVERTLRLLPCIPKDVLVVAESGIRRISELIKLQRAGVDAVLIGTTLMRAQSPEKLLQHWMERLRASSHQNLWNYHA